MKKFMYVVVMTTGLAIMSAGFTQANAQTKTVTKTKTGMSHKKKYGLIGAGAGAATGAAVSKNHVKGGIIGGVVGGGAGYLLGRHKDKKDPARKTIIKTKKKPA